MLSLIRWDGRPDNVQGHSFLSGLNAPANPLFWVLVGGGLLLFFDWAELKEKYGIRFPNLWVSDGLEEITKDRGTVDISKFKYLLTYICQGENGRSAKLIAG